MKTKNIPPAQLWLGSHDILTDAVIIFLQKHLCTQAGPQSGCAVCTACRQIREQQHHAAVWICPEKNYTLDTLTVIQERIAFALPDDQHCFFILQKADFLTTQCANSLLKSIEEPPKGYHFILCAERVAYLLPTIISRCILRSFAKEDNGSEHQTLYAYFTASKPQQPLPFLKEVQSSTITEHQSLDLADQLFAYWIEQFKHTTTDEQQLVRKRIDLFKQALLKPPMPGSSKLFWKNLFLHYHAIIPKE